MSLTRQNLRPGRFGNVQTRVSECFLHCATRRIGYADAISQMATLCEKVFKNFRKLFELHDLPAFEARNVRQPSGS